MSASESIVLSVIAGSSPQLSRVFTAGKPVSPFSVGACGDWSVSAPEVDGAHLYLAFDGQRLHIAAVSPGSNLFVLGTRIGTSFVPLAVPCNVFFGGACIAVTTPAPGCRTVPLAIIQKPRNLPDLSRSAQMQTQLFDASQAMQMRTQRMEITPSMLASLREAPSSTRVAVEQTGNHEVLPARVSKLPGTPDLASTLYDGGALRERAIQLASGSLAPVAQPTDGVAAAEPNGEAPSALRKPLIALRRAGRVRQLLLLLAPFALTIGIWGALRGTGSSAAAASAAVVPAALHSAAAAPVATAEAPPLVSASASARPPGSASAPSNGLERAALAAAFSGNKLEAAELYDRLATDQDSPVFALAARLVRADRVRKP